MKNFTRLLDDWEDILNLIEFTHVVDNSFVNTIAKYEPSIPFKHYLTNISQTV